MRQFLWLHAFAIALHTWCAVYAFTTSVSVIIPTELRRVDYDVDSTRYYRDVETLSFHLPSTTVLHGIVALITIGFHLCIYVPIHTFIGPVVWSQGYFTWRWLEYSLTCTLMTIASVTSAGSIDFNVVVSLVFYGAALQLLGCIIEQRKQDYRVLLFTGFLIGYGNSHSSGWYVVTSPSPDTLQWLEFSAYAFFYALFPWNCIQDARRRRGKFVQTDWIYNVLSLSSKFGLFWLQVGEVERKATPGAWPEFQVFGLGIVLPLLFLLAGVALTPTSEVCIPCSTSYPRLENIAKLRVTTCPVPKTIVVVRRHRQRQPV